MTIEEYELTDRLQAFYNEYKQIPRAICVTRGDFNALLDLGFPVIMFDPGNEQRATFYGIPLRVSQYVKPGKFVIDYGMPIGGYLAWQREAV